MKGGEYLDPTPLLKWIARHPEVIENWKTETAGPHASAVRALNRISHGGRMSFCVADQLCCLMGVHMSDVFGDVYWTARCNDDTEGEKNRRARERYHSDPCFREAQLRYRAEYKRRKRQEQRELREAA